MRFMIIVKASKETEAGQLPSDAELAAMTTYNEQLVKAGVMVAGEGLHPSARGARVRFGDGDQRTVIDGPFGHTSELIAGFWLWKCASRDEAIAWLERAPFPAGAELELRQVFEMEDFVTASPETVSRNHDLRVQVTRT